ncbi:MAG: hypothetical protein KBT19_06565 [Lachnospiraceae bacterium]|nr:hypothetical protein [Candidatus Colinaster equi]
MRKQIGTLSEKTIHAVVKNYYEPNEDCQEIPIEGKCADIYIQSKAGLECRDEDGTYGKIYEIQTREWSRLKPKLDIFLKDYDVTVVLPIPDHKKIIWIDPLTGELNESGRNIKYGNDYTGFKEMYAVRDYVNHPHFHIILLYMDMLEYKLLTGRSKDRKKYGAVRYDRIPLDLTNEIVLSNPKDYMMFVPMDLPEKFTSAIFAKAAKIRKSDVGRVIGLLRITGVIERLDEKDGRSYLYRVKEN